MKKLFFLCLSYTPFLALAASGFTAGNIGTTSYSFNPDTIFPSPRSIPAEGTTKGVDNIMNFAISMISPITTIMAIGATIMVILGGFYMVV